MKDQLGFWGLNYFEGVEDAAKDLLGRQGFCLFVSLSVFNTTSNRFVGSSMSAIDALRTAQK